LSAIFPSSKNKTFMKLFLSAAVAALTFVGCNSTTTTPPAADSTVVTSDGPENLDYAYTIEHPDNWVRGDQHHVVTVLKSLKAFETGDIAAAVQGFADTVRVEFDGYEATLSNDSLKATFTAERANFSNMTIKMEDWESVISRDKKLEYVSLWYKQIFTDTKGKVDSVEVMDDIRIKNGKIVLLNEKVRHYPAKK
jgi:hypothetical protein